MGLKCLTNAVLLTNGASLYVSLRFPNPRNLPLHDIDVVI